MQLMLDQVDGLVAEKLDCAIADIVLIKKVSLSIKLLERKKRSFREVWNRGSGKNLPFSSLSRI